MSLYAKLRNAPPELNIKANSQEILFDLVSCMCDNKSTMRFKKDKNDEFKVNIVGQAFTNIQCAYDKFDIEWAADEKDWTEVIKMVNTSTAAISKVRSR